MTEDDRARFQHILKDFNLALRQMVEAELSAGNSIVYAVDGHPAPPAGGMIKLALDLITRPIGTKDGMHACVRDCSTHHTELKEERRFF